MSTIQAPSLDNVAHRGQVFRFTNRLDALVKANKVDDLRAFVYEAMTSEFLSVVMPIYEADRENPKYKAFKMVVDWIQLPFESRTDFADLAKTLGIPAGHIHTNYGKGWTAEEQLREQNERQTRHRGTATQPRPSKSTTVSPKAERSLRKRARPESPSASAATPRASSHGHSPTPGPSKAGNEPATPSRKGSRAAYGTVSKALANTYALRRGETPQDAYKRVIAEQPGSLVFFGKQRCSDCVRKSVDMCVLPQPAYSCLPCRGTKGKCSNRVRAQLFPFGPSNTPEFAPRETVEIASDSGEDAPPPTKKGKRAATTRKSVTLAGGPASAPPQEGGTVGMNLIRALRTATQAPSVFEMERSVSGATSSSAANAPPSTAEVSDDDAEADAIADDTMQVDDPEGPLVPEVPSFHPNCLAAGTETVRFPDPPRYAYTTLTTAEQGARLAELAVPEGTVPPPRARYNAAVAIRNREALKVRVNKGLKVLQAAAMALKDYDGEIGPDVLEKLSKASDTAMDLFTTFKAIHSDAAGDSVTVVGELLERAELE